MVRPERYYTPRPTEQITDTLVPTASMVASTVSYSGKSPRVYSPPQPWQNEAYRHYGICGEARFAANWIANALSRVVLYAIDDPATKVRLDNGPAFDALSDLFNGADGQAQMLHALGLHLTLAGECYLVGRGLPEGGDVWEVLAVTEVKANGDSWSITDREQEGKADIPLVDSDVVIRVWRPLPEKRRLADSPFRSLMPILSEIEWATRHIFAQMASRLAGAGLLFVSDGVQIAEAPRVDGAGNAAQTQNKATALMQALATAMMRPLNDPGVPEALVPTIMTVPEDLLKSGKIAELMHFWTDLDAEAKVIRSDAIMRFADGMDIPAEKLKGLSSSPSTGGGRSTGPNHWGMWQIDEEAITLHIEPLAELISNFLAVGYIRKQPDVTDKRNAVWYDSSALRLRPDRSKESLELYALGLVSAEVVLRENRFDPGKDAMKDAEHKTWLLLQVATGKTAATPEQVGKAFQMLGVDLPAPTGPPTETARGPRALPSVTDHPGRDLPDRNAANLLLHSCEPLVFRALERAGNRLKQNVRRIGGTPPDVPAHLTHTVVLANGQASTILQDAFTGTAEMCLADVADPLTVVPLLESYVSTLIAEQSPHSRERLASWLDKVPAS